MDSESGLRLVLLIVLALVMLNTLSFSSNSVLGLQGLLLTCLQAQLCKQNNVAFVFLFSSKRSCVRLQNAEVPLSMTYLNTVLLILLGVFVKPGFPANILLISI